MSEHAICAPSGASRWISCAASLARSYGKPNKSSKYSEEGDAAHSLAAMCLTNKTDTCAYAGRKIDVMDDHGKKVSSTWEVDEAMQDAVQMYVDKIREYAEGNILLVEERVDLSAVLGIANQFGTSDSPIISLSMRQLQVHDLKYGMGVRVDAKENEQLMTYALGLYYHYSLMYEFDSVKLVIHQPRLNHFSEWECSIETLLSFRDKLRAGAKVSMAIRQTVIDGTPRDYLPLCCFMPNEDNCRFCDTTGDCRAQDAAVTAATGIEVGKTLAEDMDNVGMVRSWCKAKEGEALGALLSQKKVPGWMLVEGRKGDRKYRDEDKAARIMAAALSPDELYTKKLVSPAQAEKLLKKPSPETWARLNTIIYQEDGKPSVARDGEGRTEITVKPKADVFDNLDEGAGPWTR